jgi:hypothetical protein
VNIARDLQLLIAAVAVTAGVSGALILPNAWLRIAALGIGLLIAAYVTGVLQQFLTSMGVFALVASLDGPALLPDRLRERSARPR